jgi:hypothetical protein
MEEFVSELTPDHSGTWKELAKIISMALFMA